MLFATIDEDERVAPARSAAIEAAERAAADRLERGVNRMIFSVCALVGIVICASYAS